MRLPTALLLVLVLTLVSCGGATEDNAPTPPITPEASVSLTSATSDRILVSGTGVCDFTSPMSEQKKGGFSIYSGFMACTEEMSDPRVSGEDEFYLTETQVFHPDVAWFSCEDQVLTNEGGTWRGGGFGSEFTHPVDGELYTSGQSTLVGEGAYEGLVYHQLYYQAASEADHYFFSGWIEPAE
jgi:hypothetical protein